MRSQKTLQATSTPIEPNSSPRISFSADFTDEKNSISISPEPQTEKTDEQETGKEKSRNEDFEFLSNDSISNSMLTPDELFFEGKLLPFWQMQYSEKLNKINLNNDHQLNVNAEDNVKVSKKDEPKICSWFLDDDPSPRPPTCTVLWKELLQLKNKRVVTSTLSPSSSTSSSLSSLSSGSHVADQENEGKKRTGHNKEKYLRKVKKGLERNRSVNLKIRPMVNVPICTQGKKDASLPPLFPIKKGRSTEI